MGGHLDETGLPAPLCDRPEQIAEETAAAGHGVVFPGGREPLEGGLELGFPHQVVEPARTTVDPDPVPPETAQFREVCGDRDPAVEQIRHAALVAVEAGLDRDVGQVAVATEEMGQRMGAGAAGAADEDDVEPAGSRFGRSRSCAGGSAHAGWCA